MCWSHKPWWFGSRAFERWLGLEEILIVKPLWWSWHLYKRYQRACFLSCHVRTQQDDSGVSTRQKKARTRIRPLCHRNLEFLTSRTVRNTCRCLSHPVHSSFVTAARAKQALCIISLSVIIQLEMPNLKSTCSLLWGTENAHLFLQFALH